MKKQFSLVGLMFSSIVSANNSHKLKQSSYGVCHDIRSPYYEKIKSIKTFKDRESCVKLGGHFISPRGRNKENPKKKSSMKTLN